MSVRDTNILNHTDLKYLLIDNLNLYTEEAFYVQGNNPYTFSINKKTVYIYIKNVHQSGQNRTNPDECRIQVGKTPGFTDVLASGKIAYMLGYFDDCNVFTAWNPLLFRDRINAKKTVSLYSRFSVQERANENGIACYIDSNGCSAITFKPEYIGLYLENYSNMHLLDEQGLLELIQKYDEVKNSNNDKEDIEIGNLEYIVNHPRTKRDPNFKKIIHKIYCSRCAICGIQLELTEAAHIIPYSHEKGTDEPSNGICLCALHHTAYDRGLIYIDEDYNVKMNDEKIRYLEKIKLDGGIMKFIQMHDSKIDLPVSNKPSVEFIKIANSIRGIN